VVRGAFRRAPERREDVNKVLVWVSAAVLSAAAWAADVVVEGEPYGPPGLAAPAVDDQLELGWDNGTRRWSMAWYTGGGAWVGNQFDLSTLSSYRAVDKIKFYSRSNWPNGVWDGFRVAIYNFSTVPGAVLWPTSGGGYFFKPSGLHGHVWVEIRICWTSPSINFLAAVDQCYNYPNCDPHALDSNETYLRHSWQYYQGAWSPLEGYEGHQNLMLRVFVNNSTLGVTPTSVGRVKALYY
jgi:hypothetical protein